jgi:rhamnopyranosyl-N-acetylglucosaminyl-diphospho-decaprenol beta-1,3/1,4-galactofuranosyltransferase
METPSKKVLALVVTYNRLELLKRCITHLQAQTVSPDILVINNSSTDGTEKFLEQNGIDHITQENTGSAGGWSSGLREGWARGYQYLWMMDDDGFPDKHALEILLNNANDETICISSLVVKENAREELVFGMPLMNKKGLPVIFSSRRKYYTRKEVPSEDGKYPHAHLFNGALVNLQKAKEVGNIDMTYFMYGDEVDFFYRMKKKGQVATALKALHYHPDVSKRSIDKKKVYYFIRNTIILNHLYFNRPFTRDMLTVVIALYRIMRRNGVGQMFSYLFGSNRKFFYPALSDGYKRRKINRFV